jgi:hypothetical protein
MPHDISQILLDQLFLDNPLGIWDIIADRSDKFCVSIEPSFYEKQ